MLLYVTEPEIWCVPAVPFTVMKTFEDLEFEQINDAPFMVGGMLSGYVDSPGEKVETAFICRNVVGKEPDENGVEVDVECKNVMQVGINVLDIKPPNDDVP